MARIDDVPALKAIGAQPAGSPIGFIQTALITTLTGAVNVPNRPSTPPPTEFGVSGAFMVDFSGPITGNVSVTLTLSAVGGWLPGDVVRVRLTPATVAAHTLTVIDGGTGTPTLATMPATLTSTGFIDAQLNDLGTHWLFLNGGGF